METLEAILLLMLIPSIVSDDHNLGRYQCGLGLVGDDGAMFPRNDIDLEVGSKPINISCTLNPNGKYATEFGVAIKELFIDPKCEGNSSLRRIFENETTVTYKFSPRMADSCVLTCKGIAKKPSLRNSVKAICSKHVNVGWKPLKPENFTCLSENWQTLSCKWDLPTNYVETNYSIYYSEDGHGIPAQTFPVAAKVAHRISMYLDLRTDPIYRQSVRNYTILVIGSNFLDNEALFNFEMESYALVRPAQPTLRKIEVDATSAMIAYAIPDELVFFPPGIRSRILWRSKYDTESINYNTSHFDIHDTNFTITLAGLIPNTNYTVTIQLSSAVANPSNPDLWSIAEDYSFRTAPNRPGSAPKTSIGSFELFGNLDSRHIFVYWKRIEERFYHGDDFRYSIHVLHQGKPTTFIPQTLTSSYALLKDLSLDEYQVIIRSENEIGISNESSSVLIPKHAAIKDIQPRSFTKIAYPENTYEVSWFPPNQIHGIENYTIYWCHSDNNKDRPYQCDGDLDWLTVPKEIRTKNLTLPTSDTYQFAIAANTVKGLSSGMIWASCTILPNQVVGQLKKVSLGSVKSHEITVRWRLDCSDRVGIVEGYRISFCEVKSQDEIDSCIGRLQTLDVPPDAETAQIGNLTPFTLYKVGVAVLSRAGVSDISDFLVNKTDISIPRGEIPIESLVVGNQITLSWKKPAHPHGPIDMYHINIMFETFLGKVETIATREQRTNSVPIKDLHFDVSYNITVRACNMPFCGDWTHIQSRTAIGPSSTMPTPIVEFANRSHVNVRWSHAFYPGGPIQGFEINVTNQMIPDGKLRLISGNRDSVLLSLVELGFGSEDLLPECNNDSITTMYRFSIRAITYDPSTLEIFTGKWSDDELTPGYCQRNLPWAILLISIIGIPIIFFLMYYIIKQWILWSEKTSDMFKRIKEPPRVPEIEISALDKSKAANSISALRKKDYSRHAKPELPLETSLIHSKRNLSGDSRSTSGCESARSSEIEEDPNEETQHSAPLNTVPSSEMILPCTSNIVPSQSDPTGYSKVGIEPDVPKDRYNEHSGYVAFNTVKNTPTPDTSGLGYVPFNQISRPSSRPKCDAPRSLGQSRFLDEYGETSLAYSKVGLDLGIGAGLQPQSSSGYIPHPVARNNIIPNGKNSGTASAMEQKTPDYIENSYMKPRKRDAMSSNSPGYFKLGVESTYTGDVLPDELSSLSQAPKPLKVSTFSPYTRARTSINVAETSSMV